ncbi:unnamed protein product, partial [Iphiclides podalirius]
MYFCNCCLSREPPFINLGRCKHASFFSNLFENKVNTKDMYVCRLCHSIIKKIDCFKHQVEECNSELNNAADKLLATKRDRLVASKIEINSTVDGRPVEVEVRELSSSELNSNASLFTTVKVERDSDSERESELPLARLSGRRGKKSDKRQKRAADRARGKYDGKIRVVLLTREQMMRGEAR